MSWTDGKLLAAVEVPYIQMLADIEPLTFGRARLHVATVEEYSMGFYNDSW